MGKFTKSRDNRFRVTKMIPVRITLFDCYQALVENPTHQARSSILKNALKLYDVDGGRCSIYKEVKRNKNQKLYISLLKRVFKEIPETEFNYLEKELWELED
jgi:hypothetical protein